ncbi:ATPase, T2SS/T4P/T4SS family [Achromobacter deleyi]|uniref:ATPase, T2SS/T4P/T4SS family n=1 Tax=Achromobacter deleyi TaxID=1353891 RepID=UPI001491C393|nr:ATPase, T2SS/T4P/T4SS family [Achromobacter deleyi]QVQ29146.1 Flp pilus assembly complex ATPase component TadA [Achromobacter deleyi]UIP19266.1 Flp pilus assembly complex ATPase component TadA [Achromobacter deleyi]
MLKIEMTFEDAATRNMDVPAPVLIGRGAHCGLRIVTWRVGRQHARLLREDAAIVLEDLGTLAGTLVNGVRVVRHSPVLPDDEILIGPCRLRVSLADPQAALQAGTGATARSEPSMAELPDAEAATLPPPVPLPAPPQHRLHDRRRLHAALLNALDLRRRDVAGMTDGMLRAEAERLLTHIVAADAELPAEADRAALCREVLDEAVGLGPLEPLLAAADITEIMVNRYDEIYVERGGRLWRHQAAFTSEQSVRWVIERIVTPLGRRIDESSPMVDARLPDGSRVHAIIPPVAMKGASLTIRKFPQRRPQMPDLIALGALSGAMAQFLALCVRMRKNLVVSGGTGSGKTTLLNILSNEIPDGERVVTIEDAAELRLNHDHLVALEARPANQEGRGRIDIRELVRNALRMRPDRIVVGECRGAEAFDMLTAMNTGHEGSLTTLHANSPRDALARLEAMILMAGLDLPLPAVREHIAASVDIVVQQARLADGRRLVTSVVEVAGMESGRIQLQDLFRYDRTQGFLGCGGLPSFARDWSEAGAAFEAAWFSDAGGRGPETTAFPQGLP